MNELGSVYQADAPHPAARDFLEYQEQRASRVEEGIENVRRRHEEEAHMDERMDVDVVEDRTVPGAGHSIPIRVYSDDPKVDQPVLLWGHGGGFVFGSLETEDATARVLARELGCTVVSIGYRLAPEHPFPAALHDFYTVLERVHHSSQGIFDKAGRIIVGGQSAGANLAAATCLQVRYRQGPPIACQVLVVPVLSHRWEQDRRRPGNWLDRQYLSDPLHGHNPLAYPLEAGDLSGVPPASIVTAGYDEHRFDGRKYASRLTKAGVRIAHHHYPDTVHHFMTFASDPEWPRTNEAVTAIREDIHARPP